MRPKAYLMLFALAMIWGASFLFIKIGVKEMSPATLVALRLAGAVLTLALIVAVRPALLAKWRDYMGLACLVAIFNVVVPYTLISWGETRIFSGTASILNATTPLFSTLLASIWIGIGREPLSWRKIVGILIGFVGVWVVLGLDPRALGNQSASFVQGELAVVVASASYGVGGLLSRRYAGAGTLVGPLTSLAVAFVISLPIALVWSPPTALPSWKALAAVAALGVIGTGIAYLFYFWLIRNVGAPRAAMVTYFLPCTALIWGFVVAGEPILPNALTGLALVLFGTMVTNGTIRLPAARKPAVARR
ncbi:MAG TPA: DMT family transporter [Ktedonobacterales bacterium]|nr:DMT family transporter [Ktedonobacterales bacterium]